MLGKKMDVSAEEVQSWWIEFGKKPSEEIRNRLMEYYLPIVKYTAERLSMKLPDEVEVDDLISSGIFGLMDAIKAYDVNRGVKFETYCAQRIRGAILDELRALDWVPRLVRSRAHKLNEAQHSFEVEEGRKPNEKELAAKMKVSKKEFRKIKNDARAVGFVSLNRKWFETDSSKDVCEIDMVEDNGSLCPSDVAQFGDLKDLVTRGLSRAERLIVILYYFEEMTMKEIGETLDLSESRVSQMHTAIIERLQNQLDQREQELQTA